MVMTLRAITLARTVAVEQGRTVVKAVLEEPVKVRVRAEQEAKVAVQGGRPSHFLAYAFCRSKAVIIDIV